MHENLFFIERRLHIDIFGFLKALRLIERKDLHRTVNRFFGEEEESKEVQTDLVEEEGRGLEEGRSLEEGWSSRREEERSKREGIGRRREEEGRREEEEKKEKWREEEEEEEEEKEEEGRSEENGRREKEKRRREGEGRKRKEVNTLRSIRSKKEEGKRKEEEERGSREEEEEGQRQEDEVGKREEEDEEEEEKEDAETKPVTDYLQNLYSKTVKSVHLQKSRRSRKNEDIMNLTIIKESLDSLYQQALKKTSNSPTSKQTLEKHHKTSQNPHEASQVAQISYEASQISNQASQNLVKPDESRDIDFYLNIERMMNPIEGLERRGLRTLENLLFESWVLKVKREGLE